MSISKKKSFKETIVSRNLQVKALERPRGTNIFLRWWKVEEGVSFSGFANVLILQLTCEEGG